MSEQKTEYKWNIERLEEMRVQHEMNPSLLTTKQAYINALEYELNAATAEANKRIEALESEVANLYLNIKVQEQLGYELQANNHDLREALEYFVDAFGYASFISDDEKESVEEVINARKLLEATPAQSPQAHDNEVIEKCAKVCLAKANELKEFIEQDFIVGKADTGAIVCAQEIRALKGK